MPSQADYLYVVRMDVDPAHEEEFNRVYDSEHVPALLKVPGVLGVARYQTSDEGVPAYMAVYEIEDPNVPFTPTWRASSDSGEWPHRVRPYTRNLSRAVYRKVHPA
jgi:hypothetical protein